MTTFHLPMYDTTNGKLSALVCEAMANGATSGNVNADTISLTFTDAEAADTFAKAVGKKAGVIRVGEPETPADDTTAGE